MRGGNILVLAAVLGSLLLASPAIAGPEGSISGLAVPSPLLGSLADDLLAINALLFLISCLLSYHAMRMRRSRRLHKIERVAESLFILGMFLMVVVCGFITYFIF